MERALKFLVLLFIGFNLFMVSLLIYPVSEAVESVYAEEGMPHLSYISFRQMPQHMREGLFQIYDQQPDLRFRVSKVFEKPLEPRFFKKLKSTITALKIRKSSDQKDLMEVYMNVANFKVQGRGIGAASFELFKKSPSDLSTTESAYLLGLSNL